MKTIKANKSYNALITWFIILLSLLLFSYYFHFSLISTAVYFFIFIPQLFVLLPTKYELSSDHLLVTTCWFFKSILEFNKVRSFTIHKPNRFRRLFFGHPSETIWVKYNKFDDVQLFTTNQEIINRLEIATK